MNPSDTTPSGAVLGIGTATFLPGYGLPSSASPEGADARAGEAVLRAALASGVTYLDTAADYGDSEAVVGSLPLTGVRVCTKVVPSATADGIRRSVTRLRQPIDTILMHSADSDQLRTAPAGAALRQARAMGWTTRIGASTYGVDAAGDALSCEWVDVVQVEYSVLNQSVVRNVRRSRPEQEIVVRSVLCKGLLTGRRTAAPHLAAEVADALAGIEACARDWNRSVEELAIRFALDTPGVDVVLVGVARTEELDVALAAARAPRLSADQWSRLAAFDRSQADAVHPERWERIARA